MLSRQASLTAAIVSLAVIVGIRFSPIKVPGALVLVAGGLLASVAFDFEDRGIDCLLGIALFVDQFVANRL